MDLVESRPVSPTMVGRSAQLAELREVLKAADEGQVVAVVLGGEAGVGKTRLMSEFAAEATGAGALVLTGQCVELGGDGLPYAAIAGALRDLTAQVGARHVLEWAGPPGRDALLGLLPELRAEAPAVVPAAVASEADTVPGDSSDESGRTRLFEVTARLLERASADQPLMLVVEDLHWADSSTRDLLRFLHRAVPADARLVVAVTYRSDDVHRGHPLRRFLAELERGRNVRRMELPRLTPTQVAEQLAAILGTQPDERMRERVIGLSEGIPFFVEELVDAKLADHSGPLPDTLRDLLLVRFEQVSPATQDVLRLLSVGGNRVGHALLSAVAQATPDALSANALDAALREAVAANIIGVDGDSYVFRHALVREAIHEDLLPGEHARKHVRYAEVLEASPELVAAGSAEVEIAHHWYSAHEIERAFQAYLRAAAEARRAYAHGEAHRMGERVLDLWDRIADPVTVAGHDRVRQQELTAAAAADSGEHERAVALLTSALADIPADDPARRATLLLDLAAWSKQVGRSDGMELLREAETLVPAEPPTKLRAALLDRLASGYMLGGRFHDGIETSTAALRIATQLGVDSIASSAFNTRGISRVNLGEVEAGLADMDRARELAGDTPRMLLRYHINHSDVLHLLARYPEAVQVARAGMKRAAEIGLARTSWAMLAGNAAEPMLALGDWDEAAELITRGLDLAPAFSHQLHLNRMDVWLTLWRGDVPGAVERLQALRHWFAERMASWAVEPQFRLSLARLAVETALAAGDRATAWQELTEVELPEYRFAGYELPLLAAGARALAACRRAGGQVPDPAAARELRDRMDRLGHWDSSPVWRAVFDAELSGQAGTGTDPTAWRKASAAITASAAAPRHLRPYTAFRRAEALVLTGDREAAARVLDDAEHEAAELGAGLITGWARDLRDRSRLGTVRRHTSARPEDGLADQRLTSREAQVLSLVAAGLSNRQIGERLFISAKTVSVHVSNILAKLDAATRTEAAYVAQRDGLLADVDTGDAS